ncbi:MAG: hypothetical protein AAFR17_04220 [Pseudomonadota bacterium]
MISMKPPRLLTFGLIAGMLVLAGCRTAAVRNVQDQPFAAAASSRAPALGTVEKAIIRAGANRGWVFNREAPGHLIGNINVRGKHFAEIDVFFDREQFSILHKSSRNLNYDPAANVIHPNYNSWVTLLEQDVQKEIQLARTR